MYFVCVVVALVLLFNIAFSAVKLGSIDGLPDYRYNILPNAPLYVNQNDTHLWEIYPGIFGRLYHADPTTGTWAETLYAAPGTELGIHRHFGSVYGYTIKGLWGYYEHEDEWMAGPGDMIFETVGSVHTLFASPKSPEDIEVFFIVKGSLEFVNEYGETTFVEDWSTISSRYYQYCEDNGLEPYDLTGVRGKAKPATYE